MTFEEAYNTSKPARRKGLMRHTGSNGNGYIDLQWAYDKYMYLKKPINTAVDLYMSDLDMLTKPSLRLDHCLTDSDIDATDWEIKK